MYGGIYLRFLAQILGLGVDRCGRRHRHQLCTDTSSVRRGFTPDVCSSIQVGEERVAVD